MGSSCAAEGCRRRHAARQRSVGVTAPRELPSHMSSREQNLPSIVTCVDSSDPFLPARKTEKKLKLNRNDFVSMQESVIQTLAGFEGQGRSYGGKISAMEFGR